MNAHSLTPRRVVLPALIFAVSTALMGCGDEKSDVPGPGGSGTSATPDGAEPSATPDGTPTEIPGSTPRVPPTPDWNNTIDESGYPVMPTQ
jgi:hypothetical protein